MESLSLLSFSKKRDGGEMGLNPAPLISIKGTTGRSEKNKKSMTTAIVHLCKCFVLRDNCMSTGLEQDRTLHMHILFERQVSYRKHQ
jgi:hypothetical protein